MNILVIIPARGGSKGIPRKNLRPLAGKPLIYYSIKSALNSKFNPDVYVSTDDEEIAFFAKSFGAKTHRRERKLAEDLITLDPVIYNAMQHCEKTENKDYDIVITMQPTSPLITSKEVDESINILIQQKVDTVISGTNDTHLTWSFSDDKYRPNYRERVNRQQLPPIFKETGGILSTLRKVITSQNRIGEKVSILELKGEMAIDIDTFEDWNLAEYYLKRKTILFCLTGFREIGLGHVYNCLTIASEVLDHQIIFLVDDKSILAYDKISKSNFDVRMQRNTDFVEDIKEISPDLIINDRLDTSVEYMKKLNSLNIKTINIEDLGEGAEYADIVINAIYPEKQETKNHFYGPDYFCLRDEFLISDPIKIRGSIKDVAITFGGTDPLNLTEKALHEIYDSCVSSNIKIHVVLGLGYPDNNLDSKYPEASIYQNTSTISEILRKVDVAISSAGRTTYELASLGIPSIILCQNQRETTHFFASEENGFVQLGLGNKIKEGEILSNFNELRKDSNKREMMHNLMLSKNVRKGKHKVIEIVKKILS
jgi:CMP-N-acetylneuraminic acid synthetase/spore coat polysaccharide biosynthesis predicted glycosyltransferase SpsG